MKRKTLHLTIAEEKVEWTFKVKEPGDEEYEHEDEGIVRHGLNSTTRETIDLLVKLQRWLGDAVGERTLVDDRVLALKNQFSELVRIIGQDLYAAIFGGQAEKGRQLDALLLDELSMLSSGDLLRVQLEFTGHDEEEMSSWPWEYMFIPLDKTRTSTGQFLLAQNAQLVLSRRINLTDKFPPLKLTPPVKVLLVCAAPRDPDLGPVMHQRVLNKLKELQRAGAIQLFELIEPTFEKTEKWKPTATFKSFQDMAQSNQPEVIHFIGHGRLKDRRGELAFVGPDKADWHSNFADAAAVSTELRLVFLQACDSALPDPHTPMSGVARQCAHKNIPAVVAMQAKVENDVACTFACQFYQALAESKSVDYAVLEGRKAIKEMLPEQSAAFGVPVLYLRSYEKFLIPKPSPVFKSVSEKEGGGSYKCLRCKVLIDRAKPKCCPYCKLFICCPFCKQQLVDPINGVACDECGKDIEQKAWDAPEVCGFTTEGVPESVEDSTLYKTLKHSGATLPRSLAPQEVKVPHPTSFQNETAEN